ncbi:MAG: protein jag [Ardenticatenaceae bacterium]|nr:protein jag [Anaerolineales bacterium]MCB8922732.1 protein jag [Ardenticatenaceae bacterium]MCB9003563.1 protein jag [Ardenticatenaceae bacterium]
MTDRNKKREYEAQGKSVESAIDAGLAALGVKLEDVDVEVIDEGSRGLLGIGSRDAVVHLTVKGTVSTPPAAPPAKPAESPAPPKPEPAPEPEPVVETAVSATSPSAPETPAAEVDTAEPDAQEAAVAKEILENLLDKMHVTATVSLDITEPDDLTGQRVNVLDIQGQDLRVLIGQRGDTLNALQYILRLMVGHRLQQRPSLVIDVEGYRQRREAALSKLAERMAQKVISQKRPISLEPMPPYERRIIHMTLREHQEVYTHSVGEGKRRKVRILPK